MNTLNILEDAIQVRIGKTIDIYTDNKEIINYFDSQLTYENPEFLDKLAREESVKGIEKFIYFSSYDKDHLSIPRGMYRKMMLFFHKKNFHYNIISELATVPVEFPSNLISLRDYQKEPVNKAIDEFKKDISFLLLSKAGSGKAQPLDSLVLTPSGYVTMGSLKIGDYISNPVNGGKTKIIGVFPQDVQDVYKITFSDGSTAESTLDHLWETTTVQDRNYHRKGTVKTLKEIYDTLKVRKGKRLNHYIPISKKLIFSKKELPIPPYILGCLLGDGALGNSSIMISSGDKEIIDKFKKYCKNNNLFLNRKNKYDYTITAGGINSGKENILLKKIKELNLYGSKSDTKFIPEQYLYGSIKQRKELLQGLLDTDGTVAKHYAIEYSTSSTKLKDDVVFIVNSLGGVCKVRSKFPKFLYKEKKKIGKESYTVTINLPEFNLFKLKRKLNKTSKRIKYFPSRLIKTIEFSRKAECQCIKVDSKEQLYITNNFIVTHNTVMGMEIARRLGQKTLWLTDLQFLFEQAKDRAHSFLKIPYEDIGEIKPKIINIGKQLTVGMIPTIYSFSEDMINKIEKEFGLVIVDECSAIPTKRFHKVLSQLAPRHTLGLTAFAHREDTLTNAIFSIIGEPVVKPIPGGIVYPKIIKRPTGRRYSVSDIVMKKYKFVLDKKIYTDKIRNELIVDDVSKDWEKFVTVVLAKHTDHLEYLKQRLFEKYGIESGIVHSIQKKDNKKKNKEDFEEGTYKIMFATFNMLAKGYDMKYINRILWAFPFSSKEWVVQSVGRASREAPGKKGAIVIDYVDDNSMLLAQSRIRTQMCIQEGLHVVERLESEYLTYEDKNTLFGDITR